MPTKAILPKSVIKLGDLGPKLKTELTKIANVHYKKRLEEIVGPLESDIKIVVTIDKNISKAKVLIHGQIGDTASINAAGDPVSSHDLFRWLDEGTDVRYAIMPDDFSAESSPSSTSTTHKDYDRDRIFIDTDNPRPGIEARKWLEQVSKELEGTFILNIKRVGKAHIAS